VRKKTTDMLTPMHSTKASPRQSPKCRRRVVAMMLIFVLEADGEVGSAVSKV